MPEADRALGFVYTAADEGFIESIGRSLENRGYFTDSVLTSHVQPDDLDLALVILHRSVIRYAALVERTPGGSTAKRKVLLADVVSLELPCEQVLNRLDPESGSAFQALLQHDAIRPNVAVWNSVWDACKAIAPSKRAELERLEKRRMGRTFNFGTPGADVYYAQRDGIGFALDVAGIGWRDAFASLAGWDAADGSIIASIEGNVIEDDFIAADLRRFPGYNLVSETTGSARFASGASRLVVYNINRKKAEEALGADMLYYNLDYESFVFIQYKMMEFAGGDWRFRWSSDRGDQMMKEIRRMQAARKSLVGDITPVRRRWGSELLGIHFLLNFASVTMWS